MQNFFNQISVPEQTNGMLFLNFSSETNPQNVRFYSFRNNVFAPSQTPVPPSDIGPPKVKVSASPCISSPFQSAFPDRLYNFLFSIYGCRHYVYFSFPFAGFTVFDRPKIVSRYCLFNYRKSSENRTIPHYTQC